MITTFNVRLPGDLCETLQEFANYAINYAREEMASDYVLPAAWRTEHVSGEIGDNEITFRVIRESN